MRAHLIQAHVLQDVRHGITQLCGRSKRQIDDAERHAQPLRGHVAHQLTGAGDLERGLLDFLCHLIQRGTLHRTNRAIHHALAGHAHGHHTVRLLHTVESSSHEGVIAHRVGKDHQLGAGNGIAVAGQLRSFLDDATHLRHGIHVDTGARGGDIHAAAHHIGFG